MKRMKRFRDISIRKKLTIIITLTSIITVTFACAAFIATELYSFRRLMIDQNMTLARMIGVNCQAALTFSDKKAAELTLSSLNAVPDVISGSVYLPDGKFFARYASDGGHGAQFSFPVQMGSLQPQERYKKIHEMIQEGPQFSEGHLELLQPITMDQETIGYIYLQSSLKNLHSRLYWYSAICGIILLLSSLVAYFLAFSFQRKVSKPILDLALKMSNVSIQKDYSIRIKKQGNDELGTLFEGFNEMLTQIQERDEALYFTQFFIDHMDDSAFWVDSEARFIYVNNSMCSVLEYSREEILFMTIHDIDPNYPIKVWQSHWDLILKRKSFTFESEHMKKNGERFPVEIVVNCVEFKEKQYYCAFARDIRERKQMESQLEQAQKLEAIGTLTGGVAHDLNNILGSLVGYPELILMDLPEKSPLQEPLISIKESGEKAAAIIQDLLTLARRGAVVQVVVNLNQIVSDYLNTPSHKALAKFHPDVEFEVDLESNLFNNLGSSVHLSKTIMNLVSNAAESMPQGGKVSISTKNQYLDKPLIGFDQIQEGDYVVLIVSDTGSGISLEDQSKIFEPFYTKKIMGRSGTGLGMTVVRGTVEDHNGYIDIKSTEGEGSRFYLYFPVTRKEVLVKEDYHSIESYRGNEKILVVDDVKEQREVATKMLTFLGYIVETVASGEDAIDYMKRNTADLLLLDMIMDPGIDGLETYKKILETHPKQKAVIASGFSETERVKETLKLGAGAYVKKPYLLESIGASIRSVLDD